MMRKPKKSKFKRGVLNQPDVEQAAKNQDAELKKDWETPTSMQVVHFLFGRQEKRRKLNEGLSC